MRFRVLGPLTITGPSGQVPVTGRQRRALLAVLLLHPGRIIGVSTLIDRIWGPHRPKSAVANLRTYVYELRQLLREAGDREDRLVSHSSSYQLNIEPDELDLDQFQLLAAQAREATRSSDHEKAAAFLRSALDLWQGRPLEDMPDLEQNLAADVQALEEQYWSIASDWVDAQLALGHCGSVLPHLRRMVADRPLDEHCWLQLISALRAAGRTADALAAYRQARQLCIDELGVEPGEALQRLQAEILDAGGQPRQEAVTLPAPRSAGADRPARPQVLVTRNTPPTRKPRTTPPLDGPPVPRPTTALPPRPRFLVGRDQEREAVLTLGRAIGERSGSTSSAVTVSLTGATGTGKSALALSLAHDLRQHYPDGHLYLNLDGAGPRPKSLADALAELLVILIGPSNVPAEVPQRTALLRRVLHDRRMLLVLDDAPIADLVLPFLAGTGGSLTIVTSHRRLSVPDFTWHCNLEPLGVGDGIRLLAEMSGRDLLFEDDAAARIVAACDGLPLALRIVANRLVLCPQMSVTELAERMEQDHATLDELAASDTSIRTQLSRRYSTLDPGARRVLHSLAYAPVKVFTETVAGRTAGIPALEASRILVRLVRENLLVPAPGDVDQQRYEIPRLLRLLVREQITADERVGAGTVL